MYEKRWVQNGHVAAAAGLSMQELAILQFGEGAGMDGSTVDAHNNRHHAEAVSRLAFRLANTGHFSRDVGERFTFKDAFVGMARDGAPDVAVLARRTAVAAYRTLLCVTAQGYTGVHLYIATSGTGTRTADAESGRIEEGCLRYSRVSAVQPPAPSQLRQYQLDGVFLGDVRAFDPEAEHASVQPRRELLDAVVKDRVPNVRKDLRPYTAMVYILCLVVELSDGSWHCLYKFGSGQVDRVSRYKTDGLFACRIVGFLVNDLNAVGGGMQLVEHLAQAVQDDFLMAQFLERRSEFRSHELVCPQEDARVAAEVVKHVARVTGLSTAVLKNLPAECANGHYPDDVDRVQAGNNVIIASVRGKYDRIASIPGVSDGGDVPVNAQHAPVQAVPAAPLFEHLYNAQNGGKDAYVRAVQRAMRARVNTNLESGVSSEAANPFFDAAAAGRRAAGEQGAVLRLKGAWTMANRALDRNQRLAMLRARISEPEVEERRARVQEQLRVPAGGAAGTADEQLAAARLRKVLRHEAEAEWRLIQNMVRSAEHEALRILGHEPAPPQGEQLQPAAAAQGPGGDHLLQQAAGSAAADSAPRPRFVRTTTPAALSLPLPPHLDRAVLSPRSDARRRPHVAGPPPAPAPPPAAAQRNLECQRQHAPVAQLPTTPSRSARKRNRSRRGRGRSGSPDPGPAPGPPSKRAQPQSRFGTERRGVLVRSAVRRRLLPADDSRSVRREDGRIKVTVDRARPRWVTEMHRLVTRKEE